MGWYETGTGQKLRVHNEEDCSGVCPIHNPSDHPLKDAPTHWRDDRGLMERICEHGVGHPDLDDLAYKLAMVGQEALWEGVHGCCGESCCVKK